MRVDITWKRWWDNSLSDSTVEPHLESNQLIRSRFDTRTVFHSLPNVAGRSIFLLEHQEQFNASKSLSLAFGMKTPLCGLCGSSNNWSVRPKSGNEGGRGRRSDLRCVVAQSEGLACYLETSSRNSRKEIVLAFCYGEGSPSDSALVQILAEALISWSAPPFLVNAFQRIRKAGCRRAPNRPVYFWTAYFATLRQQERPSLYVEHWIQTTGWLKLYSDIRYSALSQHYSSAIRAYVEMDNQADTNKRI